MYKVILLALIGMLSIAAIDATILDATFAQDGTVTLVFDTYPNPEAIYSFSGGYLQTMRDIEPTEIYEENENVYVRFAIAPTEQVIISHQRDRQFVDFTIIDGVCTAKDFNKELAPDCVQAPRSTEDLSISAVLQYVDPPTLLVQLRNRGTEPINLAEYRIISDWGDQYDHVTDDAEKTIAQNERHLTYLEDHDYTEHCGKEFYVALTQGDNLATTISSVHSEKLECLPFPPSCGDRICSKYEDEPTLLYCPDDCLDPINLEILDIEERGITFTFSYAKPVCRYTVSSPDGTSFSDKILNTEGTDLDPAVRMVRQRTETITAMFGSFETQAYTLTITCSDDETTIEQEATITGCNGCLIEGDCIAKGATNELYYCTHQSVAETIVGIGDACAVHAMCTSRYCWRGSCNELKWWHPIWDKMEVYFLRR